MRSIIHISDISRLIRLINRRGHHFGFTVYMIIDEKYMEIRRFDDVVIIRHYCHTDVHVEKLYNELNRLYLELLDALFGLTKFNRRFKMKYMIYFNY